jgi:Leucine-rich repeat (LRR) protein
MPTDSNFIKSHSLSHLDIPRCNISSLSVETFANVSAMEWLDLKYNNLRTVDIDILRALPKLSEMHLYGNPLHCDCQLQEVWRWCKDRNIWSEYGECDTPSEVKEMRWGVLDKGHCLEGNIEYYGDYNSTRYDYTDTEIY